MAPPSSFKEILLQNPNPYYEADVSENGHTVVLNESESTPGPSGP